MSVKTSASALLMLAFSVCYPLGAEAVYFTIHLENGNKLHVEKYWEDGGYVRFYNRGGTVGLPKTIISNIVKNAGTMGSSNEYFSSEFIDQLIDEEKMAMSEAKDRGDTADYLDDLRDRASVIETNLVNMMKNRQTYQNRRTDAEQDKFRAQKKIEALKKDSYIGSKDLEERIALEESKIADAEKKIAEIDAQMLNTAKMIENQKRMKSRIESELSAAESP